jgi:hypothetical protein
MPEDRRKITTHAVPVAGDNQNSLTVRPYGPVLLNKFRSAKNGSCTCSVRIIEMDLSSDTHMA